MITQCNCCRINTVGQHESDCPNNPISTTISNAKGNDYRVAYLQVECPNCTRLEKEIVELKEQLVVRNGRIMELEEELKRHYEFDREELR